jgi:predicted tellurium resistance membrane protein TerC
MIELLASPEAWISFATLTVMEIVLGIDNIIFISILSGRLPEADRPRARRFGLGLALGSRLLLLCAISWIVGLTQPLFSVFAFEVTGKSLVLLAGGVFLMYKATAEIHEKLEAEEHTHEAGGKGTVTFRSVLLQILILDIVFSLDSVITAVGMSPHLAIMIAANVFAVGVMLFASRPIAEFVERHPTVKMLALSFLLLIGFTLTIEAAHIHIPKGYIYFAMGFSILVESLNLKAGSRGKPVHLRNVPEVADAPEEAKVSPQ